MNKIVAITDLLCGALLMVLPRYVLPACEYTGLPAMHCSDTARSELAAGALLVIVGMTSFFLRSLTKSAIAALFALGLSVAAFVLPGIFGYCHSTRMPCNYGMVPGVRFVAVAGGIITALTLIGMIKTLMKKGSA